ncbi:hypothetical protein [Pedobacter sp.]
MEKKHLIEHTLFKKLALGAVMMIILVLIGKEGYEFGQWLRQ